MRTQVLLLLLCSTLNFVVAVVNTGQTKTAVEESSENSSGNKEENSGRRPSESSEDLTQEGSETSNRREATDHSYLPPISTSALNLPIPVYGAPDAPSNNVVYPAPPPDVPPAPPSSLYGPPSLGKVYGVPQVNPLPPLAQNYGPPPIKYGAPLNFGKYPLPSKPVYGPPKLSYGPPVKPFKFHKFPQKNFGLKPPKPIYGLPSNYKNTINYNNINFNNNNHQALHTSSFSSSNSLSSLYNGLSSLNYQYGAPVLPPKPALSVQYGVPNIGVSTSYGVPEKNIVEPPAFAYGPPQPSPNPKPPHPGAPAPPTPPDIKYDGWQPIPGLVSKRPVEEVHQFSSQGAGYDLSPPPLSSNYGAPQISVDISHENNGLGDSYNAPVVSSGNKGVTDSYSAPLGSVTGSGGVVSSSFNTNQGSSSVSQTDSHSISLDLSSIGLGHGADIQSSVGYEIFPQSSSGINGDSQIKLDATYGPPQANIVGSSSSSHSFDSFGPSFQNSYNQQGHKESGLSLTVGLVPPGGTYGAPPSSQYGAPLHTNTHTNYKPARRPILHKEPLPHGVFQNIAKESFHKDLKTFGSGSSDSYLPPPPSSLPSTSYGVPSSNAAISFQNLAHGSSTAGIDHHLQLETVNALPLTSYTSPLGSIDGSYGISSSGGSSVGLDYSQPPITIDLTQGKQFGLSHDCNLHKQLQVPSLAYGVPSADSYTSSLSSLTTNIAISQPQTVVPQPTYGVPQGHISVPSAEYGPADLDHSSSVKSEVKANTVSESEEETHGKSYGKSVAESFGPNSELVESQSIDLNNIPLQGSLGSYTLQIQSSDGGVGVVPHTQVLNEGLLQSILQAIEQPGQKGENKYPIILQPSVQQKSYAHNRTESDFINNQPQASEINEVIVEAPKENSVEDNPESSDNEETLQLLDTSNIALYYKKEDDSKKNEIGDKSDENKVDDEEN
ncbi:uncharacterized protein LOC115875116 [Sitophilus oryzae]|uniref:Uncharacterized protein LOC115875116 n=1 Tax=Sitophilus oryzae TaxID=7048 RepID=A0A6J2X5A6_SITOR|nr:uncharacterized protein LOC115875116 [Sitophilus oryzae]